MLKIVLKGNQCFRPWRADVLSTSVWAVPDTTRPGRTLPISGGLVSLRSNVGYTQAFASRLRP